MSPWTKPTNDHEHNWRFVIVMMYITLIAVGCAYGLYKSSQTQDEIRKTGAISDYKLCESVKAGKLDRIAEYRFTLHRTMQVYQQNPQLDHSNLQITIDFYHDLIQRTFKSIVPCPPPPE